MATYLPNIHLAKEKLLLIPSFLISWWDEARTAICLCQAALSPGEARQRVTWSRAKEGTRCLDSFHFPSHQLAGAFLLQNTEYWHRWDTQKPEKLLGGQKAYLSWYLGLFWRTGKTAILLPMQSLTGLLICPLAGVSKTQFRLHP